MKKATLFLVVFLALWSAIVLVFDIRIAKNISQQWRSRSFAATTGRVLSSDVARDDSGESTSYRAQVRYEYHVDGQRYESGVVRYGEIGDSFGRLARQTVQANPAGLTISVYYDSSNPGDAVLETGISRQQLFMAVFLTPFNAVMVFLLWLIRTMWRPVPAAGGAVIRAVGERLEVNYPRLSRLAAAVGIFGAVGFAGIFILGFGWKMAPPVGASLGVWGIGAVLAGLTLRSRGDGASDLAIDAQQGTVSLRHGQLDTLAKRRAWRRAGRPRLSVPFEKIAAVEVRERVSKSSDGDATSYQTVLVVRESAAGPATEYDLGAAVTAEHARSFAAWLRETLGLLDVKREAS